MLTPAHLPRSAPDRGTPFRLDELAVGQNRIAFEQSSGVGHPVVLIHGNSCSSRSFDRQLRSPLGQKYRLVALNLPGHGHSAKAEDPACYSLRGQAQMLVAAVAQLELKDAVFVGWSLGGHILLQAADGFHEASGFVIFGAPPLQRPFTPQSCFLPHPGSAHLFCEELSEGQVRTFAEAMFRGDVTDIPESFLHDIRNTDPAARRHLLPGLLAAEYEDEVEILRRLRAPVAILHGEHDQLVSKDYMVSLGLQGIWRGGPQIVPQAGHAAQWENAEAFNTLVDEFIQEVIPRRGGEHSQAG